LLRFAEQQVAKPNYGYIERNTTIAILQICQNITTILGLQKPLISWSNLYFWKGRIIEQILSIFEMSDYDLLNDLYLQREKIRVFEK
jgi:hypothetical protein